MTTPRDDIADIASLRADNDKMHDLVDQLTQAHHDTEAKCDALQARVKELEAERDLYAECSMKEEDCRKIWQSRALRAEQERADEWSRRREAESQRYVAKAAVDTLWQELDEVYERAAKVAETWEVNMEWVEKCRHMDPARAARKCIAAAIRRARRA